MPRKISKSKRSTQGSPISSMQGKEEGSMLFEETPRRSTRPRSAARRAVLGAAAKKAVGRRIAKRAAKKAIGRRIAKRAAKKAIRRGARKRSR
jgi:hypothetical protein